LIAFHIRVIRGRHRPPATYFQNGITHGGGFGNTRAGRARGELLARPPRGACGSIAGASRRM